jgi:hypothetical protein
VYTYKRRPILTNYTHKENGQPANFDPLFGVKILGPFTYKLRPILPILTHKKFGQPVDF